MRDPAAGGVDGPELPHLVVLEVGVAEVPQGWPLGAERARRRCGRGGDVGVGWPRGLVWVHGRESSCLAATGAAAVGPHSLWRAAQGRRICGGEGTAMCWARYALDGRATAILALPAVPSRRSRPHRGMPTGPEGRHAQSAASGHRLCARGRWCCAMPAGGGTGLVVSWRSTPSRRCPDHADSVPAIGEKVVVFGFSSEHPAAGRLIYVNGV